ncbi:hypothetical protein FRC03_006542 [Tulasnella sp. 419]|nr:hypothetical protein FRC03_006542 [Tulasnella sp. 419]
MINAPVLHVNGDYPEEVSRAVETAFQYRKFFRKDIIVDLMCYRRWGHNELDEPSYTSPGMYKLIRSRSSVPKVYEEKLISEGVITPEEASSHRNEWKSHLENCLQAVSSHTPVADMLTHQWKGMIWPASSAAIHDPETGVDRDALLRVGKQSVEVPQDFNMHSRLNRHVKHRLASLEKKEGIDWGTAEALAFGSLILDGYDVRISGQDVGRGTFSHRHAMLVDQENEKVVVPLNSLSDQRKLELANSSLSEMAVLAFEYGISWERPDILPIWEAQFGDFFNGSQIIIDTYISSAETKWLKQSGLVMLLPHGLDGAGPEHSSSRIERMLQLTNDRYDYPSSETDYRNVNMHVAYPTTPAQYFHLLRRQMKRNYRKPLIVAAPKGLLRLPREVMTKGLSERVALIRLEELCPFPFTQLEKALQPLSSAKDFVWVQEEPRNQGAWTHVSERLRSVFEHTEALKGKVVRYHGRRESAVPATGVAKWHAAEHASILEGALAGL